jgi:ABC-type sugar transport system ATPase subunit
MAFLSGDRTGEGIYPVRSVAENVKSVGNLIVKKKIKNACEVLDQFGVKYNGQPKNYITSLSGGNQQKVVVARWLTTDPELLLTDDPTKGIDVQARYDLHRTFIDLANKGSGVVMVSSDDEELVEICHMTPNSRVLIMYEGKIVKELTGEAITAENILAYSFA